MIYASDIIPLTYLPMPHSVSSFQPIINMPFGLFSASRRPPAKILLYKKISTQGQAGFGGKVGVRTGCEVASEF